MIPMPVPLSIDRAVQKGNHPEKQLGVGRFRMVRGDECVYSKDLEHKPHNMTTPGPGLRLAVHPIAMLDQKLTISHAVKGLESRISRHVPERLVFPYVIGKRPHHFVDERRRHQF